MVEVALLLATLVTGGVSGWYIRVTSHVCPKRVIVAARQVESHVQPDLSRRERRALARRKR